MRFWKEAQSTLEGIREALESFHPGHAQDGVKAMAFVGDYINTMSKARAKTPTPQQLVEYLSGLKSLINRWHECIPCNKIKENIVAAVLLLRGFIATINSNPWRKKK